MPNTENSLLFAGDFPGIQRAKAAVVDCTASHGNLTRAQAKTAASWNPVKKAIASCGDGGVFVDVVCTDGVVGLHLYIKSGSIKVTTLDYDKAVTA